MGSKSCFIPCPCVESPWQISIKFNEVQLGKGFKIVGDNNK